MHATCSAGSSPMSLDVRPDHLEIVRRILASHAPGLEVWAFGSRVDGRAGKHSDLDLCLHTSRPLSFTAMGLMEEAFSDSDLPYKVDLVDWSTISPEFREIVTRHKIVVQAGPPSAATPTGAAAGVGTSPDEKSRPGTRLAAGHPQSRSG
ncbi:MAG: nucleotidyltransferase family protein [Rubrivivax sp.]